MNYTVSDKGHYWQKSPANEKVKIFNDGENDKTDCIMSDMCKHKSLLESTMRSNIRKCKPPQSVL
jgi:hypothetical protein